MDALERRPSFVWNKFVIGSGVQDSFFSVELRCPVRRGGLWHLMMRAAKSAYPQEQKPSAGLSGPKGANNGIVKIIRLGIGTFKSS